MSHYCYNTSISGAGDVGFESTADQVLPHHVNDSPPLRLWSVAFGTKLRIRRWAVGHSSLV